MFEWYQAFTTYLYFPHWFQDVLHSRPAAPHAHAWRLPSFGRLARRRVRHFFWRRPAFGRIG